MTIGHRGSVCAMALTCALAQPWVTRAAEKFDAAGDAQPAPPRRDAAEVVKEGDMSQWLRYYQRERGGNWSKTPSAQPDDKPVPPVKPAADETRATQTPDAKAR